VFYLIHGSGQDEKAWVDQGKANVVLDNLIADKKIVPMLVVFPNGSVTGGGGGGGPGGGGAGEAGRAGVRRGRQRGRAARRRVQPLRQVPRRVRRRVAAARVRVGAAGVVRAGAGETLLPTT